MEIETYIVKHKRETWSNIGNDKFFIYLNFKDQFKAVTYKTESTAKRSIKTMRGINNKTRAELTIQKIRVSVTNIN